MASQFDEKYDSCPSNSEDEDEQPSSLPASVSKPPAADRNKFELGPQIASNSTSSSAVYPPSTIPAKRKLETNNVSSTSVSPRNPGISRFGIPEQHTQSSAVHNVITTAAPSKSEDQIIKLNNKPESMVDKLRYRKQLANGDIQKACHSTDNTSLSPALPVSSTNVPNNAPAIPGNKVVTGTMPMISDNTSVTPPKNTRSYMSTEPLPRLASGVSGVAVQKENKPAKRTNTDIATDDSHKRYEELILEKFAELQLEYVHRKHCNEFFLDVQQDCRKHNIDLPANDDTFTGDIKRVCNLLWKAVTEVEEGFNKNICFPSDEMRKRLTTFRDVQDSSLPTKIGTALRNKLRTFSDEYTSRNEEIQQQEKKSAETLIEESKSFYIEQTLLKLRGRYLDRQDLTRIEEECKTDVESIFVKAFGFKSSHWQTYYTNKLKLILGGLDEIRKKNDENKKVLERQLEEVAVNSVEDYNQKMSERVIESLDELTRIEKTNYSSVMESYKSRVHEITREQGKVLNESRLRIFTKALDEAANKLRRTIQTSIKAKEDARKAEMDRQEREQRNRQGTSHTSTTTYARIASKVSNQENNFRQNEQTSSKLQTSWCAIANVGIHKTSCTFFDTSKSLKGEELQKTNEEWINNDGIFFPPKTFLKGMLDKRIDNYYDGTRGREKIKWTIVDFIIVLFKGIKSYLVSKANNIHYCVIVLPQCLTIRQQQCFRKGAEMVGFTKVDILTDTHVLALKFFTDNWKYSNPNVIAVHVSGNRIDAALFSKTDKSIECQAVAGDFCTEKGILPLWVKFWQGRTADIFIPMIELLKRKNSAEKTNVILFGDVTTCEDVSTFSSFEKTTMQADSIIFGAGVFAQITLQSGQTELVKGVLDETKKQIAQKGNKALLGAIPDPCEFVFKT